MAVRQAVRRNLPSLPVPSVGGKEYAHVLRESVRLIFSGDVTPAVEWPHGWRLSEER